MPKRITFAIKDDIATVVEAVCKEDRRSIQAEIEYLLLLRYEELRIEKIQKKPVLVD